MSKRQTSGDEYGWKRGEKGFAKDKTSGEFMKKGDPYKLYGLSRGKGKPGEFSDGKLKDHFKGAEGLDTKGGGTP